MGQILNKFSQVLEDPYKRLGNWKKINGRKVIGCFPMYAPEEIIHAAGMLPVTLFEDKEPISVGDKHLMVNACEQTRGCFDMLLGGKFDFLDGIVLPLVCDQIRFFTEVWQIDHPFPFFHQIWLPPKSDNNSKSFLVHELNRFKSSLETFAVREIPSEAIKESFRLYNENHTLLRMLYALRREKPGFMSAGDIIKVVGSGMLMLKEEHNNLLRSLLSKANGLKPQGNGKTKLVVLGHPCAIPDIEVLNLVEELGGLILDDDFYVGGRYFATDVKLEGDPIECLAEHHINMIPCVTKHYPSRFLNMSQKVPDYGDYVVEMVRRNQARGVIFLRVMYCDPYDLEFVMVKSRLADEGIPFLSIITGHGTGSLEAIRTRFQAFLEMLNK